MSYGNVHWCEFPAPDHRRPAILLTRENAPPGLLTVTVAPITSTVRPSPAFVKLSVEDGLFQDCAANCDLITTIPRHSVGEFIATLAASKVQEVHDAICFALSIE